MTEYKKKPTEYIFAQRLHDSCEAMRGFYVSASNLASAHPLKVQMSAFSSAMQQACHSLVPFQSNKLKVTNDQQVQLNNIEAWYENNADRIERASTTEWVMESNKHRREFLRLLRRLTELQSDKLLRYVLSDITAEIQLKHDQLMEKLNRNEKLMLQEC